MSKPRPNGQIPVTVLMSPELLEKLKNIAALEHRSMGGQICKLVEDCAKQLERNATCKP